MSMTLFALVATAASAIAEAAPTIIEAAGDFLRENRVLVHSSLKSATPVIREISKEAPEKVGQLVCDIKDGLEDEINIYENDGWKKE